MMSLWGVTFGPFYTLLLEANTLVILYKEAYVKYPSQLHKGVMKGGFIAQ
jgi:hypothetical protein